ncbi:MAG: efflux RND transporter periplasmic adaptor subunit, partial [Terrimicrobiaceae bacterium]
MKRAVVVVLGLGAFVSCGKPPAAVPPPPPVTFATAQAEDVPFTIETFGNCETVADVTLQAQVTGTLLKFGVAQGAMVKAGDLIAEIDPAPYQAALQEAQGNLDSAKAKLANAQVTLQRQQELYKTKTIDLADLQNAEADALSAQGDVLTAEGDLASAQINLGYCTINSPVDGKAGLYQVDAGNLVTANSTKFINIQTIQPIYVNFTISENDFDRVRQYFSNGELAVEVTIPGAPDKKIPGKLTFLNNNISSDTGTLQLQATFPNADAALWPGLFVNVRLILATLSQAIVIPSACVMIGQKGPYIFVVNADNTVAQRQVTPGQRQGDFTVITDGVKAGDKIVTAGQLGLTTGKQVNPSPWQPP